MLFQGQRETRNMFYLADHGHLFSTYKSDANMEMYVLKRK